MVEMGLVDEAEAAGADEVGRMKGDTATHRYVNGADVIRERE